MPHRSHPDRAKTPGCRALNVANSRCARRIRSMSSMVSRSVIPSAPAITVAVVQAMPFVVNTRL
jgi:hypothetical protein